MYKFYTLLLALTTALCARAEDSDTLRQVQLQEVNVSAIKENGPMRQQPMSVSLIGRGQLAANHIESLKGTSSLVPNMFIPDYGSRLTSAVYIRGIGSRLNTPAVGMYVDNIPYTDKSAFDFNFYDIERIDVMRGPQGVLYGRNTMGGLVRVYTKNPMYYNGTDIHLGYATGDNHRNASLTHYHRFGSKAAFSLGGYYEGGSGFFRNSFTGKKVDAMQAGGGRFRGIYTPCNRLSIDLTLGYDYTDEGAYPYFYTGTKALPSAAAAPQAEPYPDMLGKINNNRESRYRRGMLNAGLNIGYKADAWQMNAVTAYQNINDRMFLDQDFLSPDIYTLEQRQKINTLTEEVTFKSTGRRRWDWLTGVNAMYQSLHTDGPVVFYEDGLRWLEGNINRVMPSMDKIPMLKGMGFSGMSINFRGNELLMDGAFETPTLNLALFHQSTFHFNDHLNASLGLRLDYDHQQMEYNAPADVMYGFRMPNPRNAKMAIDLQSLESHILYEGTLKHDRLKLLPKFSLKYDFDRDNNIYASVAMGQRSGGYNLQMFSDMLQGAMSVSMMNGIKDGVEGYMEQLAASIPSMPKQLPDPDDPQKMVTLPQYVRKLMSKSMPQYETPSTQQVVYKPEYSWTYEVGSHLTLAENMLMLDAAIFYSRIYDQQIARFAPSGLGRMMVNAGKSESYGGELSLRWMPMRSLAITGNYGFTNAKFVEYDDGQSHDYSGMYVPYVPSHSMNIDAAYTWFIPGERFVRSVSLGANGSGAGRIYWTEDNTASQPFYATLGARLLIETERLQIMLWGKNLTDNRYNTFYFESANRGFEQHSKPLQVGIDLSIKL